MICALSGYSGSGKDEVAVMMKSIEPTWTIKKFAGKLKTIASILTGIPEYMFEDQDFKHTELDERWDRMFYENNSWNRRPMKVREFLQMLGTDGIRLGLHENAWVNALMSEYVPVKTMNINGSLTEEEFMNGAMFKDFRKYISFIDDYPNWVITDCRFENEAMAVKSQGGIVVRINRPGVHPVNAHGSEVGLDNYLFDYVINNDGTLDELRREVQVLLEYIATKH